MEEHWNDFLTVLDKYNITIKKDNLLILGIP
jgi:hypothetical protein